MNHPYNNLTNIQMRTLLTKVTAYDIGLALGLVVISIFLIGMSLFVSQGGKAEIYINNHLMDTVDLSVDREYEFTGELSVVKVVVDNCEIRVTESGCPLKLCQRRGAVSRIGESIVCLPNKFAIIVVEGESRGVDGVTG